MARLISALAALAIVAGGLSFWAFGDRSEASTAASVASSAVLDETQVAMQRELLATAPPEGAPPKSVQSTDAGEIELAANACAPSRILKGRSLQVLAFFLGYCPTTWVLENTAWGRSVANHVVSVLCKQPWVVRAATWGQFDRC